MIDRILIQQLNDLIRQIRDISQASQAAASKLHNHPNQSVLEGYNQAYAQFEELLEDMVKAANGQPTPKANDKYTKIVQKSSPSQTPSDDARLLRAIREGIQSLVDDYAAIIADDMAPLAVLELLGDQVKIMRSHLGQIDRLIEL